MTSREKWVVLGICFLVLFGSAADWYRKSRPYGGAGEAPATDSLFPGADRDLAAGSGEILDLNRCDAGELVRLPGIGEVRAGAIIRWREKNGPFRSVDELARVPGIGPKTVERLRPFVAVPEPGRTGDVQSHELRPR